MTISTLSSLHKNCNPKCVKNSCRRGSCRVVLPSGSEGVDCDKCNCFPLDAKSLNVDIEEIFIDDIKKVPDFIINCIESNEKQSSWVIVDFKGNVSHVGQIVKQLQVGAIAIEKHPKFEVDNSPNNLVGLIVKEGGFKHASDLERRSIKFRNIRRFVFVKNCGFSIKLILLNKQ